MIHPLFMCRILYWTLFMPRLPIAAWLCLCRRIRSNSASSAIPPAPLILTLPDAMERPAQQPATALANLAARIAHEDTVQAKAALLPALNWNNAFFGTQGNGSDTGIFVSANGPRVYVNQAAVHADVYAPGKRADYQMAIAAESISRARAEIASRGLVSTVVQNYYAMVVASRRNANAQRSMNEARQLVDITQKQELGGEAAHSDVVKAQIQLIQRERDLQEALLGWIKPASVSRFPVPRFPAGFQRGGRSGPFSALPGCRKFKPWRRRTIRDSRRAFAITQETFGIKSARAASTPVYIGLPFSVWKPTSTRCTTNSARTTWGAAWWRRSTCPSGTGAGRAAKSARPS
jgi:hypothetical protein